MKIWNDISEFDGKLPVITIGIFDGVHKGHASLLKILKDKAKETGGESVIVTLWPHPRLVLEKDSAGLGFLNGLEEKVSLLEKTGIDHLVIIPFTREFASLDSCEFIESYLVNKLRVRHLIIGYDHRFGRNRKGDYTNLRQCAEKYGFEIHQFGPVETKGKKISSTLIRTLLSERKIESANACLGYNYVIKGRVIEGFRVGRTIGFPTANIKPENEHKIIPGTGVYAVLMERKGQYLKGMLNIGYRPTLENGDGDLSIEMHIFNFGENIYQERVRIHFVKFLRPEIRFGSVEELKKQLARDREDAGEILGEL